MKPIDRLEQTANFKKEINMKEGKIMDLALRLKCENRELKEVSLVELTWALQDALEKVGVEITDKAPGF